MMRRVAYGCVQREIRLLEVSYDDVCEDYLGVPPIKAVDYVIIIKERSGAGIWRQMTAEVFRPASRVEPRIIVPCRRRYGAGFLYAQVRAEELCGCTRRRKRAGGGAQPAVFMRVPDL